MVRRERSAATIATPATGGREAAAEFAIVAAGVRPVCGRLGGRGRLLISQAGRGRGRGNDARNLGRAGEMERRATLSLRKADQFPLGSQSRASIAALSLSPRLFFLSGCQFSHLAPLARDKRLWFDPLRRLEPEPFFASCQGAQLPRLALPCPASPRGPEPRPPSKLRLLYRIRVGCSLSLVALRSLRCPSPRTMMAFRHALAT